MGLDRDRHTFSAYNGYLDYVLVVRTAEGV
jgi:hypothetical protein